MMKTLVILCALLFSTSSFVVQAATGDKLFTKEYTYNSSDDDSKNSSRKKALTQIKRILSEEVGTHIESSLDITSTSKKGVSQKYVKNEINLLSSAITKLKIIDEKWNGVEYYVKASVVINEEQAIVVLLEAIKAKASEKDVARLNKILEEQNKDLDNSFEKISTLKKTLISQEIKNQAGINELKESQVLLDKLLREKQKFDRKIKQQESQITKVKSLIQKAKNRVGKQNKLACQIPEGMTRREVEQVLGNPVGTDGDSYDKHRSPLVYAWYYGSVELYFGSTKILKRKRGC